MSGAMAQAPMTPSGRRRLCAGVFLLSLAGCASAEPEWYRLVAVPGRPLTLPPLRIELRDVRLARALERPGFPRAAADTRLTVAGGQRWAGPLDEMATQVLARNLAQRLPGSIVMAERDAIGGDAEIVVSVGIDRFEADAAGQALLSASFAIRRLGSPRTLRDGRVEERVAPSGADADALVQALSEALARLADRLAATLST